MNRKLTLALIVTLALGANAFAQEANHASFPATKTRAQVLDELATANASGQGMPTGFAAFHTPASKPMTPKMIQTASKD